MNQVKACVFDAYGTLFDVHSAVRAHASSIGVNADALSRLWRTKQLEYTWVRSMMRKHADFAAVTEASLDFAMASFGIVDPALRAALLGAYHTLDAYPEVPDVLRALRGAGIATAILSNGSPAMLANVVASARLENLFDAVLSVEEVGIYKPDARVYQLALDRLGTSPEEISFQSSNAWDAAGARAFGMRVVWINRSGQPDEYELSA
ncbi:MAG TPA: haloacid dehalogenase type II, partial [Polyangiaceae bacterium]|nr:haloacid dehalogenase type II [Polyangiaceae bacterium]